MQPTKYQRNQRKTNLNLKPKKPNNNNNNNNIPIAITIWVVLENKTNATPHPNIGLLKTISEEEWNKMSEEFILNTCKSFRRYVDTITEKKMAAILSEFILLFIFFKLKLILFYKSRLLLNEDIPNFTSAPCTAIK